MITVDNILGQINEMPELKNIILQARNTNENFNVQQFWNSSNGALFRSICEKELGISVTGNKNRAVLKDALVLYVKEL